MTPTADESRPSSSRARAPSRRVGLLGTGYIAEWHAKGLATVEGVELVGVCDRAVGRARAFAEKFHVPGVHASLERMLEVERLDAVHVLLPPDLHQAAARTLLEAGVHVLLEKPMCLRAEDCESLSREAEARGLALGVVHNFLFAEPYESLRRDVRAGVLGTIDEISISWNRELPQATHGPFDAWMLRDPRNIMLEIGPHVAAPLLDLLGDPERLTMVAGNPMALPSGQQFFRRWQGSASRGGTAANLRFSFVPSFGEFTLDVRGSLASATVDIDRNTYLLRRHVPADDDLDRYEVSRRQARDLQRQARGTLANYVLSKFHLRDRGSAYGASIAKVMDAFYRGTPGDLDSRIRGEFASRVVRLCQEMGNGAPSAPVPEPARVPVAESVPTDPPRILVLGGTGFIGGELVRQFVQGGHRVRLLARSPSKLPGELRSPLVECVAGDLTEPADLEKALRGVEVVYHLARTVTKTWPDALRDEVGVTRQIAEQALAAGVRRFVYTGTIDSYYAGSRAGTITEETPLDPRIGSRNIYARAKAASEELLRSMQRERGLPLVIVRPGIVLGRGSSPFHWGVGMWWYGSICQTWGEGRNPLPLVLVEDVASGLVAALDAPGIEGESFNLVAAPLLSAQEYLDEVERAAGIRLQRQPTSIARFYLWDMFKHAVKVLVRHPERRLPSYRDWESRSQKARFDCTRARTRLGWKPVDDRETMIRRGIHDPVEEMQR